MAGLLNNFGSGSGGILDVPSANAWQDNNPGFPTWLAQQLKQLYGQLQNAPPIPTGEPPQTTNTAVPDVLAGVAQPQPSQQPAGPAPMAAQPAARLAGRPMQLGGFDLDTIGPGVDPDAGRLPANSQPTQQQAPSGGILSGANQPQGNPFSPGPNLQDVFHAGSLPAAIGNLLSGLGAGLSPEVRARQMANWQYQSLIQRGVEPDRAFAIVTNPELAKQYYGQPAHLGDVKIGNSSFPLLAGGNGEVRLGVPGGGSIQSMQQMANEAARQEEAAKSLGTQQGKNAASLPNVQTSLNSAISSIDGITGDPQLKNRVGAGSYFPVGRGQPGYDFDNKLSELQTQLLPAVVGFMQESGITARNPGLANDMAKALADVDQAKKGSPQAFVATMGRLKTTLQTLKQNASIGAGQAPQPNTSGTTQFGVQWSIH